MVYADTKLPVAVKADIVNALLADGYRLAYRHERGQEVAVAWGRWGEGMAGTRERRGGGRGTVWELYPNLGIPNLTSQIYIAF